jgi:CBS domain-containing protein
MKIRVREIMTGKIVRIGPDETVHQAAKVMMERGIGSLIVGSQWETMGIITESDLVRRVVAVGLEPSRTRVKEIMSTPALTVEADAPLEAADDLMDRQKVRHLLVTEGDSVIGIVSARDLLHPIRLIRVRPD